MPRKKKSDYRISDDVLNTLLDIRDSMDTLEGEIEKEEKMAAAWQAALAKKDALEADFLKLDKELEVAQANVRNDPDWSDLHKRAVMRLASLKENRESDDRLVVQAKKHVNEIEDALLVATSEERRKVRSAEAALRAQLDHMRTPGKLACKAAYDRLTTH